MPSILLRSKNEMSEILGKTQTNFKYHTFAALTLQGPKVRVTKINVLLEAKKKISVNVM